MVDYNYRFIVYTPILILIRFLHLYVDKFDTSNECYWSVKEWSQVFSAGPSMRSRRSFALLATKRWR